MTVASAARPGKGATIVAAASLAALAAFQQWQAGLMIISWRAIAAGGLLLLYLLATRRLGLAVTRGLGLASPASLTVLVGTALLSLWPLLAGSFGLLTTAVAGAPLLVLPLLADPRREFATLRAGLDRRVSAASAACRSHPLLVGILLFATGWALLAVCAPPTGMDALTYHLGLPKQYLIHESLVPPDSLAYYYYWQGFETALLPLLAIEPTGRAVNLLGFATLLILADGVRRLGSGWGGERAGLVAAIAAITSPVVVIVLTHTKSDILSAALLVWSLVEIDGSSSGRRILRALLLGAALAVKPTNIVVVLPILLLELRPWPGSRSLASWVAAIALVPGYWAARNLLLFGRPFSPEMIHFEDPPDLTIVGLIVARIEHLVRSFFTGFSLNIDGPLGPLLLILSVGAAFGLREDRSRRRIAFIGGAGIVLWIALGLRQARFLLPLFIILSASGAAWMVERGRFLRAALVVTAIVSLGANVRLLHSSTSFLALQAGRVDENGYMLRWLNTWPLQQWANANLPLDARIIAVGETRFFPLDRPVTFDGYWQRSRVLDWAHQSEHSDKRLARRLSDAGFTYLLYNPRSLLQDIKEGHTPPPLCERDLETFHALLDDAVLVQPVWLDPAEPRLGIYALIE